MKKKNIVVSIIFVGVNFLGLTTNEIIVDFFFHPCLLKMFPFFFFFSFFFFFFFLFLLCCCFVLLFLLLLFFLLLVEFQYILKSFHKDKYFSKRYRQRKLFVLFLLSPVLWDILMESSKQTFDYYLEEHDQFT